MDGRPLVGDVIAGRYRIESIAGEGGMGIVYEAEHVILRQRVAVKALHPGAALSHDAVERFSLEASAIARIASDHVVRIMDAGSLADGAPYLVMEYLEGCDLAELLSRRGPLPSAEVVDYALQALDALAHAHAAHVIHRDLKPANLYLATLPGGGRLLKLLDFGISKSFEAVVTDSRIVGSPAYMAPEQLRNEEADARTDIWALGVVMYELVSGEPPFGGELSEIIDAVLHRDVPPLPARVRVPSALAEAITRCLRRDRAQRFASTAELARALVPLGSGQWTSALARIEKALSASAPARAPRRFETLENALQALESKIQRGPAHDTREVYGATMPAPPSQTQNTLRILLVDDSGSALPLHRQALTTAGFEVHPTNDVEGLEALVDEQRPHLVLLDLHMPVLAADEVCRRLKAKFRATVPIVLLSDQPQDVLAGCAKAGGADAYLSKTEDDGVIVDLVKNILAMTLSPEDLP